MFDTPTSRTNGAGDPLKPVSTILKTAFLKSPAVLSRANAFSEQDAAADKSSPTDRAAAERNQWHCVPYSPAKELRPRDAVSKAPELPKPAPRPKPLNIWALEFRYWPVWDVGSEALLAFRPQPISAISQRPGSQLAGPRAGRAPSIECDDLSADDAFELDFRTLYDLARKFESLADQDKRFPMICPVHFETMASLRLRQEYLSLCNLLPELWRRLLTFEVVSAPSDVPPIRIQAIARDLQPFCRSLHWHANMQSLELPDLDYTGVAALGLKLADNLEDEADAMKAINAFASTMAEHGIETFLHGVSSKSLATNAFCANFRYISGSAIHPAIVQIEHLRSFEPIHLVAGPNRR